MNVTVENLGPCRRLVRVEVDAAAVDEAFKDVAGAFQREARFPGFRPGKAPLHMVLKSYNKQIEEEVKRKLIADNYRKAMEEQKLPGRRFPGYRGDTIRPRAAAPVRRHP